MATPAEIVNDLRAWARVYDRREPDLSKVFDDLASAIDDLRCGHRIDGRRWFGLQRRLDRTDRISKALSERTMTSLWRGRRTAEDLNRDLMRAGQ